jgi:predicted transcriptional regulator
MTAIATPTMKSGHSDMYGWGMSMTAPELPSWTFLTNHAHVLLVVSRDGDLRQRDISQLVGITPGAVQRILHDLEEHGYLKSTRVGRRNHYEVIADVPLRHPLESNHTVQELLQTLED